jgi:RimJ/RimL family protein N-acetyltransferase
MQVINEFGIPALSSSWLPKTIQSDRPTWLFSSPSPQGLNPSMVGSGFSTAVCMEILNWHFYWPNLQEILSRIFGNFSRILSEMCR